jgi:hypothetical protein
MAYGVHEAAALQRQAHGPNGSTVVQTAQSRTVRGHNLLRYRSRPRRTVCRCLPNGRVQFCQHACCVLRHAADARANDVARGTAHAVADSQYGGCDGVGSRCRCRPRSGGGRMIRGRAVRVFQRHQSRRCHEQNYHPVHAVIPVERAPAAGSTRSRPYARSCNVQPDSARQRPYGSRIVLRAPTRCSPLPFELSSGCFPGCRGHWVAKSVAGSGNNCAASHRAARLPPPGAI